jgi:putative colanic acid biosynthesis acetyltransferase WcaF
MRQEKTDLSLYDNSWYKPGGGAIKRGLWYLCNIIFFQCPLFPFGKFKRSLLRLFGAKIGKGVIIKPSVNIKYPWKLEIGNHVWIGEGVWIDNLVNVYIKDNACISQGAMLLCGNHNFKKITFDLLLGSITLEEGTWIGAKAVVCPGVICGSHSVLTVGSVAIGKLESYSIYQGNPAVKMREREIKT